MVPIGHANAGGGSIRIPAACCGLVGLKPARNRVSVAPTLGDSFLTADGVVSRTVADTAQVLDVLAGYEVGDANWAPPPARPFSDAVLDDPDPMRIGLSTLPPIETEVDPVHVEAVRETAQLLESLGHTVEEVDPPWQVPELFPTFSVVWAVGVGMTARFAAQISGREPTEDAMESLSWELYRRGRDTGAYEHYQATVALQAYARALISFMEPYDAFLTPMLAERPVPIGEIDHTRGMQAFARSGRFTPYTAVANVTGQPAIALPLFFHGDDGLPTAVQLFGRPAGEWSLLALSAQLERERPWADRRPEPA